MKDRVLIDRLGPIALAIAPHIGSDGAIAGLCERCKLMTPGVPALGKAVAEQNQRSLSLLGDVEADAVDLDDPLRRLAHVTDLLAERSNARRSYIPKFIWLLSWRSG